MTAAAFQNAVARLIVDEPFRARVRAEGEVALPGRALTAAERRRLLAAAADPGMEITATLHRGFRLSKLLGRLPLTFELLDPAVSRRELDAFWAERPPKSFYYIEEAIAFSDYLARHAERLAIPYLAEVVAFERAGLELQRARPDGSPPPPQRVAFEHDPTPLIEAIAAGKVPESLPRRPCELVGRRVGGDTEWTLTERALPGA